MLIRFTVENWMSFREEACLSMIASSERQHSERLKKLHNYRTRVLPLAVVYGGNASGKSNLVKAISFAQEFIVSRPKSGGGTRVKSFRIEKRFENRPTKFGFQILLDKDIYEYKFSLDSKRVLEEELKLLRPTTDELIFRRSKKGLQLSDSLSNNHALITNFEGTDDNQLYLANSVGQKRSEFKKIFDWFEDTLTIVFPHSYYASLPYVTSTKNQFFERITKLLSELDSGITNLHQIEIPLERIPRDTLSEFEDDPDENAAFGVDIPGEGHIYIFKDKGILSARKLITTHRSRRGESVDFALDEESDGTRRLLDILPAFLLLESSPNAKVFIIDELDRSLHALLAKRLLERYTSAVSESSHAQLIFTTHNLQLMDQNLLRRDELWVTERDKSGNSSLTALSEYKDIRNDKDIRKSYIQGRMGGVPRLSGFVHGIQ